MVSRQPFRFEMVSDNVRCNSNLIDHNASLPEKKVAEAFKNVLPVLVTCKIIISDMEIKKFKRVEKAKNWRER